MKNKSVVFIRSNPVDPDSRVEKEVNSLIKEGYDVKVVAWDRNSSYKIKESFLNLKAGKVKIFRFGIAATYGGGMKSNLRPLITFQIKLFRWLIKNRNDYQIIHACDFDTAYTAYYCSKLLKKKLVYDIFDYYVAAFSVPKKIIRFIEQKDHKIINFADGVIICTEKRKDQLSGTSPRRLTIIHNSPSSSNLNNNLLRLNPEKIKIAYVGILAEGRFLKELAEIISNKPECELHIGGFGQFEDYFTRLSLKQPNIVFYGKLTYEKTLELENSCDIMTAIYDPSIPNHKYAAPNKFYESLMLGKPVIMIKNTGMDRVVSEHNLGEVVGFSKIEIENAIDRLIQQRSIWPEISKRMKQIYMENYSWDEMENRLKAIYEEL